MNPAAAPVLFEELTATNGRRIGIATLASEKTLHAISLEMVQLLTPQLQRWQADPGVAMVILQAQGEKAFCAGGDLQQLYRSMREHHASPERDDIRANTYAAEFFEQEYRLDYLIHSFAKPILCWGHGIVMGGGIGLMAGCSHRVVTEKSRLAMPEITIGLYPDVGGSWFLARMPGKTGIFLALTGANLNASDALFAGLADYRVAHAGKQAVIDALLVQSWGAGNDAELLDRVLGAAQASSLQDGTAAFAVSNLRTHFDLIESLCRRPTLPEIVEGILALSTDDAWLSKAQATLRAGAPGSAWLGYALQKRVRPLSLAEVFRLEFVVSLHCAARPDFVEGIRALIIEKDQRPQWSPASLASATPQWVEGFFADPWSREHHPLADLGA
ncbi:enoyl-CoA hydratase [Herbaspirillum rubrisubalbicans]|uniref:3-hydroxyisobutyryl-CoA hydrolase n=1 Tax=Herbaspirillum rubrisubalbicans TaxID=80842 RepID=A0ABX9C2D2_9BURK|nr:enoyl-CoA hydratase/isomerase family protein [Herbaspirillum rubrisubalbicans]RAM64482.1 enoyl-CoA hydratase [Herbaspirillum rubrisubalbicans]RAN45594.1 enoyl-CoA hydratase [Herbaspirillum rubrisubalbicans]